MVRGLVESAGGSMESYPWMLAQYDGLVIFELPDAQTATALSRAVTGSGAFSRFETHELIEGSDLAQIAERAKQISYQPPGTWQAVPTPPACPPRHRLRLAAPA